ncbi:hypothetical protein NMY22_g6719 [Coprinellus aureogranulatus]|nr:hypothetical protein NMY22_g6719 [Coprinellus aureogranulatus]
MGPTGTGKSTFINIATRTSQMETSNQLESCTQSIKTSEPFTFEGRTVVFIDTPGFDDTLKPDADILRDIASFLAKLSNTQKKLAGVIYLKDISEVRMKGSTCKNLRLFHKLCGDDSLRNVVILTTMWDRVSEGEGLTRQKKLGDGDSYFKPLLDKGAVVMRHDNTSYTADKVLQHLFFLDKPTVLQIQKEMESGKQLGETDAGKEVLEQLETTALTLDRELAIIEAEMAEAEAEGDTEALLEITLQRGRGGAAGGEGLGVLVGCAVMPAALHISKAALEGMSTLARVDKVNGHMEGLVRVTAAGGAALGTVAGVALMPVALPVVAAVQAFSKESDGKK